MSNDDLKIIRKGDTLILKTNKATMVLSISKLGEFFAAIKELT